MEGTETLCPLSVGHYELCRDDIWVLWKAPQGEPTEACAKPGSRLADPGLVGDPLLGYDEVRAVKPLPHLGWRDRLDCILCQEDSNLFAQDRGVPDCHRSLTEDIYILDMSGYVHIMGVDGH